MSTTAKQAYFTTAKAAGYTIDGVDRDYHVLVIDEPTRYVLVLEDVNATYYDSYYVTHFSKVHNDYPGAAMFEGTLLNCLDYISNMEQK